MGDPGAQLELFEAPAAEAGPLPREAPWLAPSVKAALAQVMSEIERERAAIVVAGSAGTGKTFLAETIARTCVERGLSARHITHPDLLGVAGGRSDVLVVDEADAISDAALQRILAAGSEVARMTVFLCLPSSLRRFEAAEVPVVRLRCLSSPEARACLADWSASIGRPDVFEPDALALIIARGRGLPRLLRSMASFALFSATHDGAPRIALRHVAYVMQSQLIDEGPRGEEKDACEGIIDDGPAKERRPSDRRTGPDRGWIRRPLKWAAISFLGAGSIAIASVFPTVIGAVAHRPAETSLVLSPRMASGTVEPEVLLPLRATPVLHAMPERTAPRPADPDQPVDLSTSATEAAPDGAPIPVTRPAFSRKAVARRGATTKARHDGTAERLAAAARALEHSRAAAAEARLAHEAAARAREAARIAIARARAAADRARDLAQRPPWIGDRLRALFDPGPASADRIAGASPASRDLATK